MTNYIIVAMVTIIWLVRFQLHKNFDKLLLAKFIDIKILHYVVDIDVLTYVASL